MPWTETSFKNLLCWNAMTGIRNRNEMVKNEMAIRNGS